MSTQNNPDDNDLYGDEPAQRVESPPEIPKAPPGRMENVLALASNPKAKRGLILSAAGIVVAVGVVAITVARINNPPAAPLPPEIQGANVGGTPGTFQQPKAGDVGNTQQFQDMVTGVEQSRQQEAKQSQSSVQPLAIGVERSLRPAPIEQQPQAVQQTNYVAPTYQTTAPQADPAYTAALQNARAALDSLNQNRAYGTAVFDPPRSQQPAQQGNQAGQAGQGQLAAGAPGAAGGAATQNGNAQNAANRVTMIAAGKVESVRLDTAVNSDVGGEFVGTLLTGPYAGARMIGTAERAGTLVKPKFTVMSLPSTGISVQITALGLDPQTLENGTATDVDRKLFVKYGVQPIAAALSAVGQAIANSGGTTVITGDSTVIQNPELDSRKIKGVAVGAAAQTFSKDVGAMDTQPTVRVAPGTIIGVVFTRDVVYAPQ